MINGERRVPSPMTSPSSTAKTFFRLKNVCFEEVLVVRTFPLAGYGISQLIMAKYLCFATLSFLDLGQDLTTLHPRINCGI